MYISNIEKDLDLDFFRFKVNLFAQGHLFNFSSSLFILTFNLLSESLLKIILVSSANKIVLKSLEIFCKSLIYIKNKSGPRT